MRNQPNLHWIVILFFAISALNIIAVFLQEQTLIYVSKPLIIPVLIWYYVSTTVKIDALFLIGLILCYAGDILLLFNGEIFFITGLILFLLAHIFYSITVKKQLGEIKHDNLLKSIIPFALVYVLLLWVLYPYLASMRLPVIVYGLMICLLGTLALHYFLVSKQKDALYWLIGAVIFIASDAILAINKFVVSNIYLGTMVMITYVIAQYFITRAMLIKKVT